MKELAKLVLRVEIQSILQQGNPDAAMIGSDWGDKLPPEAVLMLSDNELDDFMRRNANDGIHTTGMIHSLLASSKAPGSICPSILFRSQVSFAHRLMQNGS